MTEIKQFSALGQLVDDIARLLERGEYDGKTLIWFGYAMHINAVQRELMKRGRGFSFAVDNEKFKWGLDPCQILECRPPSALGKYVETGIVFISSIHYGAMAAQVKSYEYSDEQIIFLKSPVDYMNEIKRRHFSGLHKLREMSVKESQQCLLKILIDFRDYCDRNDLRYFLAEGTLLGAVRHKGFIPWDNDVDVFMPVEDYNMLLQSYRHGGKYDLLHWGISSEYNLMFAKIVDTGTFGLDVCGLRYLSSGFGIDIFPIGGFPADIHEREKRIKEIYTQNIIWDCQGYSKDDRRERVRIYNDVERNKYRDAFDVCEFVGMYHFVSKRVGPWAVPRKCFSEQIEVVFEGEIFKGPKGYDEYLSVRYGDYMTPPPESERFTHPAMAYRSDDVGIRNY